MTTSSWKIATMRRVAVFHSLDGRITGVDIDVTYTEPELAWDDIILGATGPVVVTAPSIHTADLVPMEELAGLAGEIVGITVVELPPANGGIEPFVYGEVYERIWCVPSYMRPQNPALNADIPFILWNAYPVPPENILLSIGGSGQVGLTLDLIPPRGFFALEELVVNLQIGSDAPIEISATYIFTFEYGQSIFVFETVIADWVRIPAEVPVVETWGWLSNVIGAWDSTEQRISIRRQPRRRIEYTVILEDDLARQREYARWYSKLASNLVVPFYQYATRIVQDSNITDTKIYFDPARTDVRDGELVVVYRMDTEESFLLHLDEVEGDGATLATPLTVEIKRLDVLAPAFVSRLENLTGPQMTSVAGQLTLQADVLEFRPTFNRPGSLAIITEFDGLPVLDKRPDANDPVPDIFDVNPTLIDTESGLHGQRVSWLHAFVGGIRKFTVPRILSPGEMDWWRDFLTDLMGQREPFLMPSWRQDLTLATIPTPGDFHLEIQENIYSSQQWPYNTYKRLQLENSYGEILYRKVTSVEDLPGGTTLLTLEEPLPLDVKWEENFMLSFLNRVRLYSDQVVLTHYAQSTVIEFSVRTTDQ